MHQCPEKVKQGIEYFNHADYYEAHEYFEDAWRETADDSRELYRALLHLSGGYYRLTQDRPGAARKFFLHSLHWLETLPNTHQDLDVGSLKAHLQTLITEINSGQKSQTLLRQYPYRITSINNKRNNMKILITGFEPFGEHIINPSQLLIQTLPNQYQGVELVKTILPVHHQKASEQIRNLIFDQEPDVVMSFGLAAGRAKISLERVALNLLDYAIADNVGVIIENQPINKDGPAAYFSTLPLQTTLTALIKAGIPAEVSLTAGAYICNQVFYSYMHTIGTHHLRTLGGFIHLPALPEQAAKSKQTIPSMSFDLILKAAEVIISTVVDRFAENTSNQPNFIKE